MNQYFTSLIVAFCFSVLGNCVQAQEKVADSVQQQLLTTNMETSYNKIIGRQSRLYSGFAYQIYSVNSTSNAYFKDSTKLVNGAVKYDGILYKNVPLMYDIYADLLISRLDDNALLYKLLTEKVDYFNLLGHHFINTQFLVSNKAVSAGFYDELYENKLQLLAKRAKTIQKTITGGVAMVVYFSDIKYYLKKDGLYYDVSSKSKFLDVLKDKKKELKKYLKDNNLSYSDNPEPAMIALVNYYDRLTN